MKQIVFLDITVQLSNANTQVSYYVMIKCKDTKRAFPSHNSNNKFKFNDVTRWMLIMKIMTVIKY